MVHRTPTGRLRYSPFLGLPQRDVDRKIVHDAIDTLQNYPDLGCDSQRATPVERFRVFGLVGIINAWCQLFRVHGFVRMTPATQGDQGP